FAVLLGDDIVESEKPCLKQMMEVYEQYKSSIVGVQPVPWEEVSRYGLVDGTELAERVYKANRLVEKPKREDAPSNLAILGRYILTPRIFDMLGEQQVGVGGEIQLTDAISRLSEVERIIAYDFEGKRHDVGEKMGFIQTTIHYALQHDELKDDLLRYMKELVDNEVAKAGL
ncbi:MAG TPA: sugar phosphate nucleotidyltransferase, partial [Paenibacillus sp.]